MRELWVWSRSLDMRYPVIKTIKIISEGDSSDRGTGRTF